MSKINETLQGQDTYSNWDANNLRHTTTKNGVRKPEKYNEDNTMQKTITEHEHLSDTAIRNKIENVIQAELTQTYPTENYALKTRT